METDFTRKMLKTIKEGVDKTKTYKVNPLVVEEANIEKDNFLTRSKILMEEEKNKKKNLIEEENNNNSASFNDDNHGKGFQITKSTPQFGDVRVSQEEAILKTIGEQVKFDENSLVYYPDADDLVFNGEIPSMNSSFQFRYNDPSGCGCYIFCDGLQLTDENARTVGKIKDAFINFKNGLIQDSDLFEKLKKVAERNSNN